MKGWKKIFHASGNEKNAGEAILISEKIDFKIKTITGDKEGHYIMTEGSIQEENGNRNTHIDNYLKCEWIKCSNQKTQAC